MNGEAISYQMKYGSIRTASAPLPIAREKSLLAMLSYASSKFDHVSPALVMGAAMSGELITLPCILSLQQNKYLVEASLNFFIGKCVPRISLYLIGLVIGNP